MSKCVPFVLLLSLLVTTARATAQEGRIVEVAVLPGLPAELPLEHIRARGEAGDFAVLSAPRVHLGYTREDHWFRVELRGGADSQMMALELSNPRLGEVTLHLPRRDGTYGSTQAGVRVPFWSRQLPGLAPAFPVWTRAGEAQTCYISVRNFGSLRFDLRLLSLSEHNRQSNQVLACALLVAGALLVLAVYNFCIFLHLRQRGYLWIALFLLSCTVWQMTASGTANMFLWPNAAIWSRHALLITGAIALLVGTLMANTVLESSKHAPRLGRLNVFLAVIALAGALLSLADNPAALYLTLAAGIISPILAAALAVLAHRGGCSAGRFFLCSWGLVLAGLIIANLVGPGYVPANVFTLHFMDAALVLAGLGWSFALTGRLKVHELQQRRLLESLVEERTRELRSALDAVKTLEGLLPICSCCKKIRDDQGYWQHVETYLQEHTEADFSHGICPDCAHEHYPEYFPREEPGPITEPRGEAPKGRDVLE